jgi:hypothetical protein
LLAGAIAVLLTGGRRNGMDESSQLQ